MNCDITIYAYKTPSGAIIHPSVASRTGLNLLTPLHLDDLWELSSEADIVCAVTGKTILANRNTWACEYCGTRNVATATVCCQCSARIPQRSTFPENAEPEVLGTAQVEEQPRSKPSLCRRRQNRKSSH